LIILQINRLFVDVRTMLLTL